MNIAATAFVRDRPRLRSASTAGFSPVAKKSAIKIKTNICDALASARIKTNADSAPMVTMNPK
jgi:hypothetical protein